MAARTYTDEERAEARALAVEVGPTEAGERLGIPSSSISRWMTPAEREQWRQQSRTKTDAAHEAVARKWAELRAAMVDDCGEAADRILRLVLDHAELLVPTTAADLKALATAMGILIDKAQLLGGDATARVSMPWDRDDVVADAQRRAEGLRVIEGGAATG